MKCKAIKYCADSPHLCNRSAGDPLVAAVRGVVAVAGVCLLVADLCHSAQPLIAKGPPCQQAKDVRVSSCCESCPNHQGSTVSPQAQLSGMHEALLTEIFDLLAHASQCLRCRQRRFTRAVAVARLAWGACCCLCCSCCCTADTSAGAFGGASRPGAAADRLPAAAEWLLHGVAV